MKNRSLHRLPILFGIALLFSCSNAEKWVFQKEISLNDISPIGLIATDQHLWLSDVANNRIIKTDLKGKVVESYSGFERPMHIALHQSKIYVPEYTSDTLKVLANGKTRFLSLGEKPDAPASVAVSEKGIAVADFYNGRVLFQTNGKTIIIGKEGHGPGELYYPTDVEIYDGKIYVADAYNNRAQVFDLGGNSLLTIGESDGIQVATGIHLMDQHIFITDFEGNRILRYDLYGNLKQVLHNKLNKPTDVYIHLDKMFVSNYGSNSFLIFKSKCIIC